LFLGFVFHKG